MNWPPEEGLWLVRVPNMVVAKLPREKRTIVHVYQNCVEPLERRMTFIGNTWEFNFLEEGAIARVEVQRTQHKIEFVKKLDLDELEKSCWPCTGSSKLRRPTPVRPQR